MWNMEYTAYIVRWLNWRTQGPATPLRLHPFNDPPTHPQLPKRRPFPFTSIYSTL